jgi:hypothetical protein
VIPCFNANYPPESLHVNLRNVSVFSGGVSLIDDSFAAAEGGDSNGISPFDQIQSEKRSCRVLHRERRHRRDLEKRGTSNAEFDTMSNSIKCEEATWIKQI